MQIIKKIDELRKIIKGWKREGMTLSLIHI